MKVISRLLCAPVSSRALLSLVMLLTMCCQEAAANLGGFYYRSIDVEAQVHENNVWELTETFDIVFEEPRHGFYRYIPRRFTLDHQVDGKLRQFLYKPAVDQVSVDGREFSTDDSNDEFAVIRIGSADREVEGPQQYVVRYTYAYPDDRQAAFDYLFHTVLGTEFEEPVGHLTFTIHFDKPLPDDIAERLQVFAGEYGQQDGIVDGLQVEATPTLITGQADSIAPRHGVTLYARLPADYYVGTQKADSRWCYLFLAATIAVMLLLVVLLSRLKRRQVTKVIEFYPPDDISSAEVGMIIDHSVDDVDIASLIPWLAGKGYISVREVKSGKIFKRTDLELTKLRELPDDAPRYQRKVMRLLFRGDESVVRMKDIGQRPSLVNDIKTALDKHFSGERKLSTLDLRSGFYLLLPVLGTLTLSFNSAAAVFDADQFLVAMMCYGIPCLVAFLLRIGQTQKDLIQRKSTRCATVVLKAVLMLATWAVYAYLAEYDAPLQPWTVLAVYVVSFILNELAGRFYLNTDYRVAMMGRLLGFREFIETAEQSRLETLQHDDPEYFYKVLPYAMVFGLSSKWADLFKNIRVEQPQWYQTASPLMGHDLTRNISHSFSSTAHSAITTISHDSSSHSGGGGGFSGGGGGGGGGGSW